jgi:hypothetical protein
MKPKDWYFEIHDYCNTLSEVYGVPLVKVAGILSALSPNTTFRHNVISLENFLKTKGNCKVTTYNGQKEKALSILNASDKITPSQVMDILGKGKDAALKTKAFFDNIYNPYKSDMVTIDLWMIRWANIEGSLTPKRYREVEQNIKDIAHDIGLRPHQVQAKIWVDIRGGLW